MASSLQQDFPPASPLDAGVFFLCFFGLIPDLRDIFRHLPLRDLPLFGSPVVTPRFRGGAAVPLACEPLPRRCLAFYLAFTAAPLVCIQFLVHFRLSNGHLAHSGQLLISG